MKLDAKDAAIIAKKYFEETKGHLYFLFETIKIGYAGEGYWTVGCEVKYIRGRKQRISGTYQR